jgi:spore coat polysaccharide biosynthesis protein SpsF
MNIVTVIQARTSSSRLPNKVLFPLCGEPLIVRMAERVQQASSAGKVVVATSSSPEDDVIEYICDQHEISCFRGSLADLLDRHYQVALAYHADAVVKIPSDCPLIDPEIINRVIDYFKANYHRLDYVSNLHPATYPDGNDIEIMSVTAMEMAWEKASRAMEREHTTPYFWENPHMFAIGNVTWESGLNYSASHRWTIDYEEDYLFIKRVYEELYPKKQNFGIGDILSLIQAKPELAEINRKYSGRYWYENHLNELQHIDEFKQELKSRQNVGQL